MKRFRVPIMILVTLLSVFLISGMSDIVLAQHGGGPGGHGGGHGSGHGPGHGGHHGHWHRPDSLQTITVSGITILDTLGDSSTVRVCYYLDEDGDGAADYRLAFGPPWYDPGNGAARPAEGEELTITGGLMTRPDPDVIVVYEINGLWWRDPGSWRRGRRMGQGRWGDKKTIIRVSNHPNPANPETQINYTLQTGERVRVLIYNMKGQTIRTYEMGYQAPGSYNLLWDGRDVNGVQLASGIYFYRIEAGPQALTKRMVLLK